MKLLEHDYIMLNKFALILFKNFSKSCSKNSILKKLILITQKLQTKKPNGK